MASLVMVSLGDGLAYLLSVSPHVSCLMSHLAYGGKGEGSLPDDADDAKLPIRMFSFPLPRRYLTVHYLTLPYVTLRYLGVTRLPTYQPTGLPRQSRYPYSFQHVSVLWLFEHFGPLRPLGLLVAY